jgi:hypothetical protein
MLENTLQAGQGFAPYPEGQTLNKTMNERETGKKSTCKM